MVNQLAHSTSLVVIVLPAWFVCFHSRCLKTHYRGLHYIYNSLFNQIEFVLWSNHRNPVDGTDRVRVNQTQLQPTASNPFEMDHREVRTRQQHQACLSAIISHSMLVCLFFISAAAVSSPKAKTPSPRNIPLCACLRACPPHCAVHLTKAPV